MEMFNKIIGGHDMHHQLFCLSKEKKSRFKPIILPLAPNLELFGHLLSNVFLGKTVKCKCIGC